MVEAADVHTVGLGGDSHVTIDSKGDMVIGPRRVVPLCLLAAKYPAVEQRLRSEITSQSLENGAGQFAIPWRQPPHGLSQQDMDLLARIKDGPLPLSEQDTQQEWMLCRRIERLEKMCLVQRAAFTPTDALHVLGHLNLWNKNASRLGAEQLALRMQSDPESIASDVLRAVSERVAKEIVSKILGDEIGAPDWEKEPTATSLLQKALNGHGSSELSCELRLARPLVGLGAPIHAYLPTAAEKLHTELIIPPHAQVANAAGAVSGRVVQRIRVLITPIEGGNKFRLHMPEGIIDFDDLEQAIEHAQRNIPPYLQARAKKAGADKVEIIVSRNDREVKANIGWVQQIHLDTELIFTAMGHPAGKEGN